MANKLTDPSRANRKAAIATERQDFAEDLRQAMADWDAATPAQREEALAIAADRAARAERGAR